ncbi:uncharacterized protein LOC129589949 [Paramacrobiotus metropolitanus]|uniref:uncharacterized protein LOC129589949 n=1 Tax=Paramacrobiotus metropolitanus TaxID=2943436 RepID=UPI0024457748|nr:uncharacterized protein LOC129589949 [Paramacrobiotus metropolitanus]
MIQLPPVPRFCEGLCAVAMGFQGTATLYHPATGACGKVNTDDDMVVSLSHVQYGDYRNPSLAAVCGKCVLVKSVDSGEQVKVKVAERCRGCMSGAIQLSPAAFKKLAIKDLRLNQVIWNYVEC